jgi:hypothetical protein
MESRQALLAFRALLGAEQYVHKGCRAVPTRQLAGQIAAHDTTELLHSAPMGSRSNMLMHQYNEQASEQED